MINNVQAIVLAAGKSTRFNTNKSKLTEKICGQEMILFPMKILESFDIPATIVVGYQKEIIEDIITKNISSSCTFVEQKEQRGTGHAVACTKEYWDKEHILILNGDLPLVDHELIQELYNKHIHEESVFTFAIAHNIDPRPNSYGKVVVQENNIKIVEAKDAQGAYDNCCINAGIYIVRKDFLLNAINEINISSTTGELYLTSLPEIACNQGKKVAVLEVPFDKIRGVNTLEELWAAETIKKTKLIYDFMKKGVRFESPIYVVIDITVEIGAGSYISQGVILHGKTTIGQNCTIQAFSLLNNATIEDNATINSHSVIENAMIKQGAHVGPFALIHSESIIGEESVIGHFVETKRSTIGHHTKAKHLTYLGDAHVGNNVTIGAGAITCNYNGQEKNKTIISDDAFIGSNNSLVAPVTIGKKTFTAAGSVITQNIPDNAFAIARSRQIIKEDYAKKYTSSDTETDHDFIMPTAQEKVIE